MSKIDHPFLRQIEVIIGPLPEYLGGGDLTKGIRFFGDGSPNGFRPITIWENQGLRL